MASGSRCSLAGGASTARFCAALAALVLALATLASAPVAAQVPVVSDVSIDSSPGSGDTCGLAEVI